MIISDLQYIESATGTKVQGGVTDDTDKDGVTHDTKSSPRWRPPSPRPYPSTGGDYRNHNY